MMNPLNFENENYITIRAKGGTSTRRASTSRYVLEGVTGTHVKCNGLIVRLVSMGPYEIPGKYEFEDYVTCALEAYISRRRI